MYSDASILLLDDPLASLDVHTAKDIVHNALRGDLVNGRTIILVTHNIPLVAPLADRIIVVSKDGHVSSQDSIEEVLRTSDGLRALANKEEEMLREEKTSSEIGPAKEIQSGKLILAEEKAIGKVEWEAYMLFAKAVGGIFTWLFVFALASVDIINNIVKLWFIGFWSSQYDRKPVSEVPAALYVVYSTT